MSNPNSLESARLLSLAVAEAQSPVRLETRTPTTLKVKAKGSSDPNATISSIFDQYDINRVRFTIGTINTIQFRRNKMFYEGDHWQCGDGWVGPAPAVGDTSRAQVMGMIQNSFVSKNVIAEIVDRHVNSLLSRLDASWRFLPTTSSTVGGPDIQVRGPVSLPSTPGVSDTPPVDPEAPSPTASPTTPELTPQQKLALEVTPAIASWWNEKEVSRSIRKACESVVWSGRGGLRIFIPSGKLVDGNVPKEDTLEKQLQYIYVEHPDPSQATMARDRATMEKVYLNLWWEPDPTARRSYIYCEIGFVDFNTGLTVIKFDTDNPMAKPTTTVIGINNQNVFFQMEQKPMITDSIVSQQKLLNKSLTMLSRNVDIGGFLERVILNADLPGEWMSDPQHAGGKRFQPRPIEVGAGKTTVITSQVTEDDEGKKIVLPADIRYRDPVKIDTFSGTKAESYRAILEETSQTFTLSDISEDGRIQARADFATSLSKTKSNVDNMIVWLLNTVLQLAATFSGTGDKYSEINAISDIRPDIGPLTPKEREIFINMYKSGLLSRESTMIILGVDDPDHEVMKINSEKRITTPAELAQILTALSKTGWKLAYDQLPEVDDNILGLTRRNVDDYKKQLEEEAALEAPSGGNSGSAGGSPQGSTNKPHVQSPGPGPSTS